MIMLSFYLLVISSSASPMKPFFVRCNMVRVILTRIPVGLHVVFLEMRSAPNNFCFYKYTSVYAYTLTCLNIRQSGSYK